MAHVVECLPSKLKALSLNSTTAKGKKKLEGRACSQVAGVLAYHVWGMGSMTNMVKKICLKRHSEGWDSRIKFVASLSYVVRLYLKKKNFFLKDWNSQSYEYFNHNLKKII
jgi:hypothetical protein